MFCTSIFGLILILTPAFSICLATLFMAILTWGRDLAPVQTTLPLRKSSVAVLGSFSR